MNTNQCSDLSISFSGIQCLKMLRAWNAYFFYFKIIFKNTWTTGLNTSSILHNSYKKSRLTQSDVVKFFHHTLYPHSFIPDTTGHFERMREGNKLPFCMATLSWHGPVHHGRDQMRFLGKQMLNLISPEISCEWRLADILRSLIGV